MLCAIVSLLLTLDLGCTGLQRIHLQGGLSLVKSTLSDIFWHKNFILLHFNKSERVIVLLVIAV